MFQDWIKRGDRFIRQNWIGYQVRKGILPVGVDQGEIYEALRHTKKLNVLEMFGFLRVRHFRKRGHLYSCDDYGLVSCKKVTTVFANYIVTSLGTSTAAFANFKFHDMGDNSQAESNGHTALNNSRETRVSGTQANNGANIYKSVANINATAGYTATEHGIFNIASAGVLLDRNLIANAPVVIANDVVEFTYELTVNAES